MGQVGNSSDVSGGVLWVSEVKQTLTWHELMKNPGWFSFPDLHKLVYKRIMSYNWIWCHPFLYEQQITIFSPTVHCSGGILTCKLQGRWWAEPSSNIGSIREFLARKYESQMNRWFNMHIALSITWTTLSFQLSTNSLFHLQKIMFLPSATQEKHHCLWFCFFPLLLATKKKEVSTTKFGLARHVNPPHLRNTENGIHHMSYI